MCGQRLQGRTNSTSGVSAATLDAIEHSVTSTTFAGRLVFDPVDHGRRRAGEVGGFDHVRRALGMRDDLEAGLGRAHRSISSPVKRSCTSHEPFQVMISTLVLRLHVLGEILVRDAAARAARRGFRRSSRALDGRAADIALGLHVGAGVDVGDDRHAGIGGAQRAHVLGRDRRRERAARAADPGSAPSCPD